MHTCRATNTLLLGSSIRQMYYQPRALKRPFSSSTLYSSSPSSSSRFSAFLRSTTSLPLADTTSTPAALTPQRTTPPPFNSTKATMTHFRIAVTTDTICPWCYVGHKQLKRAQETWTKRHPADTFAVTYHPFQLHPEWPRGPASSHDKGQYYRENYGPERARLSQQRLTAVGRELGIAFKFGGRTGNTRDSHRLVQLGKKHGNETELRVINGLYNSFFENEGDISQYDVLRKVALGAGISEAEFQKAIIDSDEGGDAVDEAVVKARLEGISGVPDFQIQDRFQINGGQPAEVFVQIFEKVKALEAQSQASS
ncbi:hypothetical protein JDV02_004111 [Purpureocillium takamizusanense]|uniref:DSBA-like thioredoxin domain-containing protein n=1 Tax=Purpureocillium takamizusanense TaxID=2060973 RepID=A0A9Q8VAH2_9HYPO|nr:uncharacterized protein JDV02_004111 [Purpureocillium takamizusanense]UNI17792.1 hypothetical protein JDV02_004111 [Purpureocillium takamizusanense]